MRRRLLVLSALLALWPAPGRATIPATPVQKLLSEAATPAEVRVRLGAFALERQAAGDADGAGEAWSLLGRSWLRTGIADSAAAYDRLAWAARGAAADALDLADAVFLSGRDADAAELVPVLERAVAETAGESPATALQAQGRLAWAHFLTGHADSARALFEQVGDALGTGGDWAYRRARERLAANDAAAAYRLLAPLAERSRMQDQEVMELLRGISGRMGGPQQMTERIAQALGRQQRREEVWLAAVDGHRLRFTAPDHAPLSGVGFWRGDRARRRAAVVIVEPGDSLASYDSLATGLASRGWAVLLLEPRGTGWSVGPDCPSLAAWAGREDLMELRVAADVRQAVRALAARAGVDTTRVLVAGAGRSAAIAILAAALDRRVAALLLLSPTPDPVVRGPLRAALARTRVPVFFQLAPEDYFATQDETESLYEAGNRAASRVVDAKTPGHGPAQMRDDPQLLVRLTGWLDGVWGKPRPGSATRPAPRPKR